MTGGGHEPAPKPKPVGGIEGDVLAGVDGGGGGRHLPWLRKVDQSPLEQPRQRDHDEHHRQQGAHADHYPPTVHRVLTRSARPSTQILLPPRGGGDPGPRVPEQKPPRQALAACSLRRRRTSSMSTALALAIRSSSAGSGSAPGCAYRITLSRMTINVGIDMIPKAAASSGCASVSTLPKT